MNYWKNYFIKGFGLLSVVSFTFIVAVALSIIPLPYTLKWLMPNWPVLVLIYWIIFLPNFIGMAFTFFLGITIDLLMGNLFGITSTCLMPVAFFADRMSYRFRSFNLPQQFLAITSLVAISHLIRLWLQLYVKHPVYELNYWLTIPFSAFAWPFVCGLLNCLRKLIRFC